MSVETLQRPSDISETAQTLQLDLVELNEEFELLEPSERITRAYELFAGRIVLSSSFGPTAPVLLKLVSDSELDIPVVSIRHGHETERTKGLISWYERELDLDLRVYDAPRIEVPPEDTLAFETFQRRTKVEPFQRMLDDLQPKAYLSGLMRWQSEGRANAPIVRKNGSVIAVNAIADLSREAVDAFFEGTGLPKNDDYFDPAKGADQKTECGLNTAQYAGISTHERH